MYSARRASRAENLQEITGIFIVFHFIFYLKYIYFF